MNADLNLNQREAVLWNDGALLVLAGPGSGKTKVLTERAARLLQEFPDSSVLALTFTTKAADEMRERLEAILGGKTERARLCTFHSFASDILRQFGSEAGIKPDFSILTTDEDRLAFLEEVLNPRSPEPPPWYSERVPTDRKNLLNLLDRLFAASYDGGPRVPGLSRVPEWVEPVFRDYCRKLISKNRLDFPSLVHSARLLLQERPHIAKMLRYAWTHLCVDEFQDTNKAQYDLLKLVVMAGKKNLFVVADDDQILYQWNGASPERLIAIEGDFDMSSVQLPRNYRCPPSIIEMANRLIVHNKTRSQRKLALVAERQSDEDNVSVLAFDTMEEEADGVADLIVRRNLAPKDCVVLARNAKVLGAVATALSSKGIGAWLASRKNEFLSYPVVWFHSILRLANNRHDREFVRRVCVAWKGLGFPLIEVDDVEAQSAIYGGDLLRAWLALAEEHHQSEMVGEVKNSLADRADFGSALSKFWGWHRDEQDEIVRDEIEVWKEIDSSIRGRVSESDLTLNYYLQEMDLQSKAPPKPADAVPCLTVHGSKGGEFEHVFLMGMAEEVFPSFQSLKAGPESPELEEERRACFVAVTRVQSSLTISYARRYNGYRKQPSRFLTEMGLSGV